MLNLYVEGKDGHQRIYTEDGDALLVNSNGVPYYDPKTGSYRLEKYYKVDSKRFAVLDANGNPIRNNVPISTTPKMPSDMYAEGKSAEELKNQLEAMGMNVEFEYVVSSKPDGTITYVYDKAIGKQGGEIKSGSVLTKGMTIVIQVAGVPETTPPETSPEPSSEPVTEPYTEPVTEPPTEPTTAEQQDEAPQNFFQRIGTFFRDLFDKIFGIFRR